MEFWLGFGNKRRLYNTLIFRDRQYSSAFVSGLLQAGWKIKWGGSRSSTREEF
jgi:hypothetical protein